MKTHKCPWCDSERTQIHLWLKDEFLTKEDFQIYECLRCGLLFTEPKPSKDKIGEYYKSEEYYSHQENKKGFIPKLYERVKAVNLKNKFRIATSGKKEGNLLDIGCGVGDFIHFSEQRGWQCTGVEPSEEAKAIAKKRIKAEILSSQELEQLPNESFDIITMWHVLEHVEDIKWQIAQLERLIKKDGRVVIAVPNFKSYDATFYKEKWAAYDVPRHLYHFNKETIIKIFKTNRLNIKETNKLRWDAFYVSYMSEQYKHHAFPLIKGAYRGWLSNWKARKSEEWSSKIYVFEKQKEGFQKFGQF